MSLKSLASFLLLAVIATTLSSVFASSEERTGELTKSEADNQELNNRLEELVRKLRSSPRRIFVGRREMDMGDSEDNDDDNDDGEDEEKRNNPRRHLFIGKRSEYETDRLTNYLAKRRKPQRVFIG